MLMSKFRYILYINFDAKRLHIPTPLVNVGGVAICKAEFRAIESNAKYIQWKGKTYANIFSTIGASSFFQRASFSFNK